MDIQPSIKRESNKMDFSRCLLDTTNIDLDLLQLDKFISIFVTLFEQAPPKMHIVIFPSRQNIFNGVLKAIMNTPLVNRAQQSMAHNTNKQKLNVKYIISVIYHLCPLS